MITLNVEDADVHTRMNAVSPSIDLGVAKWRVGDTVPQSDWVTFTEYVGQISGTFFITLKGNGLVAVVYEHRDSNDAVVQTGGGMMVGLDSTPYEAYVNIPAPPLSATKCRIGIKTLNVPPGAPTRVNRWLDPRCTTTSDFGQRYSWQHSTVTGATGAITGLDTALKATCPATQSASASRGVDLYQSPTDGVPDAYDGGNGVAVVPGEQITISGYMRSNKAIGARVQARCWSGTAWTAAATYGTQVASAAGAWTRVSVTLTVPAGAEYLCAAFQDGNSTNWVANDYIYLTGVLFENSGSVATYFDGTTKNGLSGEVYWEDAPNESRSLLYSSALQTIEATDSSLNRAVFAEELVGAAIERDFRRSVADIFNSAEPLITAGTPGLRKGTVTFLCSNLAQADSLDYTYSNDSLVTLKDETDVATNLLANPDLAVNQTGWGNAASGGFTVTRVADSGAGLPSGYTLRVDSIAVGSPVGIDLTPYIPCVAGDILTYSWHMLSTVALTLQPRFNWGGASPVLGAPINVPGDGVYHRYTFTDVAPEGAYQFAFRPYFATIPACVMRFRRAMLQSGPESGDYFDGDYRPAGYNSRWNGTPNSSTSTLYKEGDLTGLKHRALNTRLSPETIPGKSAKWLYEVEFREQTR